MGPRQAGPSACCSRECPQTAGEALESGIGIARCLPARADRHRFSLSRRHRVRLDGEIDDVVDEERFHQMERVVSIYRKHVFSHRTADVGFSVPKSARRDRVLRFDASQDSFERLVRAFGERTTIRFAKRQSRNDSTAHFTTLCSARFLCSLIGRPIPTLGSCCGRLVKALGAALLLSYARVI